MNPAMLFSLPLEIEHEIASYLDPASCISLALTCQQARIDFEQIVKEHLRLLSFHEKLETGSPYYACPAENKIDIVDVPRKGWYITECTFPLYWGEVEDDQADSISSLYKGIMGRGSSKPHELDVDDCFQADHDHLLAPYQMSILIHYFPCLTTIRITGWITSSTIDERFFRAMSLISQAYQTSELPAEIRAKLPLKHLTTAVVSRTYCTEFHWCRILLPLPSLRLMVAKQLESSFSPHDQEELYSDIMHHAESHSIAATSNVTDLVFLDCVIDMLDLNDLLRRIKALESFSLDITGCGQIYPNGVLGLLVLRASHSLTHLALDIEELEENFPGPGVRYRGVVSLRSCSKLQTLRLDWRLLFPRRFISPEFPTIMGRPVPRQVQYVTDFDVHSVLPESLESLHISGHFNRTEWGDVNAVLSKPNSLTPKLKNVFIQDLWGRKRDSGTDPRWEVPFSRKDERIQKLL